MRRAYFILRVAGYAGGLLGMALLVWARQHPALGSRWSVTGGVLLGASFLAFFASYVLYALLKLARRSR